MGFHRSHRRSVARKEGFPGIVLLSCRLVGTGSSRCFASAGWPGLETVVTMPAIAETYSLGLPVEVSKIDQELKKLWRESEGAATRASLINLAVYSEAAGSLNKNTQLMASITENHACRAIVIEADCNAKEDHVDAWISAHCHVSHAGSKQVCSEQVSFLLKGGCTSLLPNMVFSHLDSDLP